MSKTKLNFAGKRLRVSLKKHYGSADIGGAAPTFEKQVFFHARPGGNVKGEFFHQFAAHDNTGGI